MRISGTGYVRRCREIAPRLRPAAGTILFKEHSFRPQMEHMMFSTAHSMMPFAGPLLTIAPLIYRAQSDLQASLRDEKDIASHLPNDEPVSTK